MKKTPIISMIAGIGAAIGAFAFLPDMAHGARDWFNEPSRKIMFAMKQYDIRTDELAEDRNVLRDRIIRLREALAQVPPSEVSYRQHLEELIREAEQELQKKQRMLDQAEDNDRDILEDIHRSTA